MGEEIGLRPGIGGESFKLQFKSNCFRKNHILNGTYRVTKAYDYVWWKRFLRYIGFTIRYTNTIKVKKIT